MERKGKQMSGITMPKGSPEEEMRKKYLSPNQYARHRGISITAVRQAIRNGRIEAKRIGRNFQIDQEKADREWAENTDESKPLNSVSGKPQLRANPDSPESPISDEQIGKSFARSRAAREAYQARLAKLEYERESGKLVDADEVKVACFNAARIARDGLLNIPDRLSPVLTGKNDSREIHEILNEEIKKALEELCNSLQNVSVQKP